MHYLLKLKKGKLVIAIFIAGVLFTTLRSCTSSQSANSDKQLYEGLSRNEILNKCITCHPNEYNEEKNGPHSNTFHVLLQHQKDVNAPNFHEKPYTDFVNGNVNTMCVNCHASKTLFQENYKGFDQVADLDSIISFHSEVFNNPMARTDTSSFISGVDCITCHFAGDHVVAGADFKEKPENRKSKDYCFPMASKFLSSDLMCASCHADPCKELKEAMQAKLISPKTTCNSCHLEYKNGVATHYYYWRHDDSGKKSEQYNQNLLSGLQAKLEGDYIQISWVNTGIPHKISKCRDYVTTFEVKDSKNTVIGKRVIRLNRKKDHALDMASQFKEYCLPGKNGFGFTPFTDTIIERIPVVGKAKLPLKVVVSVLNKAQYWIDDSLGIPMVTKTIVLPNTNIKANKLSL